MSDNKETEIVTVEEGRELVVRQNESPIVVPTLMTKIQNVIYCVPVYSLSMVLIYIAMYYSYCVNGKHEEERSTDLMFDSDDNSPNKIYRLYTYSLLHLNNAHLVNNCIAQLFFGGLLEYHSSSWRVFGVHTLSIIFGALTVQMNNDIYSISNSHLLGVSGGVYGLLASLLTSVILNFHEMEIFQRYYYIIVVGLWLISDVACYFYMYDQGLSYSDHLGGAVCGFLSSFAFYKNIKVENCEKWIIAVASILNVLLFMVGFINMYS